jgi:N-acetylneuraminic acid mutarotase
MPTRAISRRAILTAAGCLATTSVFAQTAAREAWAKEAPMLGRQNEASTAVLDGKLYVIGGFENDTGPTTRVQVYDGATKAWRDGVPLPDPVHHSGAVVVNGRIYLVGGFDRPFGKREPITRVVAFDPARGVWERKADLPRPVGALAVGAVGDLIIAAGGERRRAPGGPAPKEGSHPEYEPIADVMLYDAKADRWSEGPSMKVPRDHAQWASTNGRFYVIGGRDRPVYDIRAVEIFDPATRSWSEGASMPSGRSGGNAAVLDGWIVVFGGEGNNASPVGIFDQVEAYDPKANVWQKFSPMPLPRHSLAAGTLGDRILLPGGSPKRGGSEIIATVDSFRFAK